MLTLDDLFWVLYVICVAKYLFDVIQHDFSPVIVTSLPRPKTYGPVTEKLPYPVRDQTKQR